MTQLKKVALIWFVLFLAGCSSQPSEKGFVGVGNFDEIEAAKTRVSLGLTYLKNGNFSQAKFNLDKALEFAPRSGEANYAMAFYYQQVNEFELAQEYYQSAIGYSRNDPDVLNSYGVFLCEQGSYDEAKTYFLRAVDDKKYISTAETYENLALCSIQSGNKVEAITYLNNALSHQPTRASSLLTLAELYVDSENWDLAEKTLWKYKKNGFVNENSLWLSFQTAQAQNKLREALEFAEYLKSVYPQHSNTLKATERLGKFQPTMSVVRKERAPKSVITQTRTENKTNLDQEKLKKVQTLSPKFKAEAQALKNVDNDETSAVEVMANPLPNEAKQDPQDMSKVNNSSKDLEIQMEARPSDSDDSYHIVKAGENLYRISLKYNVKMRKLLEWNNLQDASSIKIGSKLRVRDPN